MPEISLKAYFARLNSLLSVNSADEVMHHARHILQTYPKNVTAYRFLGRALVLNGRWEEGREALRRVLSVYPDDYIAHLGLSEANEHLSHPDEAIWHLERAYEQSPNNKEIMDALRGLYRRYRNVENQKMPLTSAAVARQYARSGAYAQAIDTLRSARARMNDRLDLKLLLGQLLWDHGTQQGAQEEAGEIAMDVLKVLPDCLDANRIMAKLWLSHGLPSEAQRFVSHLEAVDPYLAIEVVQGSAPDDDVFRLDELDYVRTSASEMASARPDWLQEISTSPAPVLEGEAENNGEDWTNWTSVLLGNQNPPAAAPPAEVQVSSRYSRFVEDDDQEDELPAYVPPSTGGLTDLFGKPSQTSADELAELFGGGGDDNDDPMAWMRDAGIEIVDEEDEQPSFDDLFAEEANSSSPMPNTVANPMAWLEQSNSDLILEPEAADDDADLGDENDFSWMRDDVFGDDAVQPAETFAEAPQAEQEEAYEAFDWAQADQLLDEAFNLEGHFSADSDAARNEREAAAFSAESPNELDDLFEATETPAAETDLPSFEDATTGESAVPGPRRGLTALLQEAKFDWMTPAEQSGNPDEFDDEWMNQFGPAEPRKAVTDAPDWLTDLQPETAGDSEDDEWFKPDEHERLTVGSALAGVESFAQISDEEPPQDEEDSDWLAEFAPEQDGALASEPVNDASGDAVGDDGDTGALPDWLTDVAPQAEVEDAMRDADPEDDYTWMNDDEQPAAEPDDAPAAAGDVPDWLAELKPEEPEDAGSAQDADADDEPEDFSWMNDAALTQAESAVNTSAAVGAIDWLSELGDDDEAEPQAAIGHEDDEYTWMNDDEQPAEPEAEPAAAGDIPDWLSELEPDADADESEPVPDAEPASEAGDYSWMSSLEDETELALNTLSPADAPEAAEPAAESDLAWLSELEDEADEVPVAEHDIADADLADTADADADYTWMREEPVSESEPEPQGVNEFSVPPLPIPVDDIDWLSELQAEAETDATEPEAEPAGEAASPEDDYTWMNELTAEGETISPAGEIDWTSELATGGEEEDYTWMRDEPEGEADESLAAVASDDLDWLSELESDSEPAEAEAEPVAQPEASDEELAWMAADDADEDAEAVASDVPDWLAASAPAEAAVTAQADEELAWLAADDEPEPEEAASESEAFEAEPMAEADAEAESTLPDWLRDAMPAAAAATVAASTFDDAEEIEENEDQFAASLEDDDVLEPTPASNAPDWLNAMVPGLDVDYDAPEDEWTEEDDRASFGADEREYAWVDQMVEEELAQVESPAFSFTRPPAWFASLGQGGGGAGDGEDDFPDWVSDDGEAGLPDYLR